MASRTLLVNPTDSQKLAYNIVNEALDIIIKSLKAGEPIKNAYLKGKEFIASKNGEFATKIHNNFGFGVNINNH